MNEILRKVTSRKFLLALVGMVSGLALAFGIEGSEIERVVGIIGGIVTAAGSIVTYINGEARVDAEAVRAEASVDVEEDEECQTIGL